MSIIIRWSMTINNCPFQWAAVKTTKDMVVKLEVGRGGLKGQSTRRCARSFGKAAHSSANLAWEGCGLGSGPHTGPDGSAAHGEEEGASMWAPFSTSRLTLANQIRISCDTVSIFRALSVFFPKKNGSECIFWKFRWYLKPNARIENAFYSWIYI